MTIGKRTFRAAVALAVLVMLLRRARKVTA